MPHIRQKNTSSKLCTRFTFMTHGGANQSLAPGDLTYTFPPNLDFCKQAVTGRSKALPLPSMSARVAPRLQHENRKRQVCQRKTLRIGPTKHNTCRPRHQQKPTLKQMPGIVPLILYSRPVPHQQVHQPTSCLSKIPLRPPPLPFQPPA